jgi:hypothetical protein
MKSLSKKEQGAYLTNCNQSDLIKLLKIARLGRLSNSELIIDEDWIFLAASIQKDFGDMTVNEATTIVQRGIKGQYNDANMPLNFTRIYKWFQNDYRTDAEKKRLAEIEKYAIGRGDS